MANFNSIEKRSNITTTANNAQTHFMTKEPIQSKFIQLPGLAYSAVPHSKNLPPKPK